MFDRYYMNQSGVHCECLKSFDSISRNFTSRISFSLQIVFRAKQYRPCLKILQDRGQTPLL